MAKHGMRNTRIVESRKNDTPVAVELVIDIAPNVNNTSISHDERAFTTVESE